MNSVIKRSIDEFNSFKHPFENIYRVQDYTGNIHKKAFLIITTERNNVDEDYKEKCHIHYKHNFGGSETFKRWLRRFDYDFEFYDERVVCIFLKITFD